MKKLTVFFISALICATNIFAQKIPAGRDILPVVLDFANDKECWAECEIQIADIATNEYVITGYNVEKNIVGFIRKEYTVSISRTNTELLVSVSDMYSIGSDKEGVPLETATQTSNTKQTMDRLAGLIKKDLSKRLLAWGDKEYKRKLDVALTSPVIMNNISRQSALVFKKFVSDNKIIGKPAEFDIKVIKVDSSSVEGYSKCIVGQAFCGYKTGSGGIPKPEYVTVNVYSNDTPSDTTYKAKGTIKDVKRADIGGLSIIEINE